MQGTSVNIGELWVTYQIRLFKPMLYDALGNDVDYFSIQSTDNDTLKNYTTRPFGELNWGVPEIMTNNINPNSTMLPVQLNVNQIRMPMPNAPKTFLVVMHWNFATNAGKVDVTSLTPQNCSFNTALCGGSNFMQSPDDMFAEGTELSRLDIICYINIGSNNLSLQYWGLTLNLAHLGSTTAEAPCDYFQCTITEVPWQ